MERLWRILTSDVTVFSGYRKDMDLEVGFCRLLRKKSVYLMHGCVSYEKQLNQHRLTPRMIRTEQFVLHNVNLILTVSEPYRNWVVQRYPEVEHKIHFLNLGIDEKEYREVQKSWPAPEEMEIIKIAAAGGDRIQKNNREVCEAVEKLSACLARPVVLNLFGTSYSTYNVFSDYPHTSYKGLVPQEALYRELAGSQVFVLNSEVESFGLSAIDALMCGCSVLITKNAGICSLLSLENSDVILDVHDPEEIAAKIAHLIQHPNHQRLVNSIDFENCSWEKVAERLYAICFCLKKGQVYTSIQ